MNSVTLSAPQEVYTSLFYSLLHKSCLPGSVRSEKVELTAQVRKQQARIQYLENNSSQLEKQVCSLNMTIFNTCKRFRYNVTVSFTSFARIYSLGLKWMPNFVNTFNCVYSQFPKFASWHDVQTNFWKHNLFTELLLVIIFKHMILYTSYSAQYCTCCTRRNAFTLARWFRYY